MNEHNRKSSITGRAWVIWGAAMFAYLLAHFHRLAANVLREPLTMDFTLSATAFGNIAAAYFYAYMAMQMPSGVLVDAFGPRAVLTAGSLLAGIASLLFALSPNPMVLFLSRLLIGVGVSVMFVAILKVAADRFPENRFGTMAGLSSGLGNIGGLASQTPLFATIAAIGWRASFSLIGLWGIIAGAVCFFVLKENHHPEKPKEPDPVNDKQIITPLLDALRNPRTWPPTIVFVGFFGGFICLTGSWGQGLLTAVYGLAPASAANYVMLGVLGFSFGSIGIGRISDAIQRRRSPTLIVGGLTLFMWILLVFFPHFVPLPVLMFTIGLGSGLPMTTLPTGKEVNHPDYPGTATGIVNIGGFFGGAIGPLGIGLVFDFFSGSVPEPTLYRYGFFVCVVLAAIGFMAALKMTETFGKNIYHQISHRQPSFD